MLNVEIKLSRLTGVNSSGYKTSENVAYFEIEADDAYAFSVYMRALGALTHPPVSVFEAGDIE